MRALVTGASSGIGEEIAKILDSMGYDVVIAARREDRLKKLAAELKNNTKIIACDLSDREECRRLFQRPARLTFW